MEGVPVARSSKYKYYLTKLSPVFATQPIYETSEIVESGKERFTKWLEKASLVYGQVITTITNHLDSICNYFLSHASSGVMEGINNKIKQIKRQAYGFTNFDNFRIRLLACFAD